MTTDGLNHGLYSTYTNGECRCPLCTEAARAYHEEYIARKRQELAEHPERFDHGKVSTYNNYGCHCVRCSNAAAKNSARKYKLRKEKAS